MWHKFSEEKPIKDGEYLTVRLYSGYKFYHVYSWANDLSTKSYEFEDNKHSGFWEIDSEWGAFEIDDIEAWMEIEEYEL